MWHHDSKLNHANVIAGFESNDDAEEAVLGLRMLGYRDAQIGYYSANGYREMDDQLAPYHRFAGSVVGAIIGAAIGWALARWAFYAFNLDLDQFGLVITVAITSATFFGMLGGCSGLWLKPPQDAALVPNGFSEPYVITVDAGETRELAWSMIRKHGGHELLPIVTDLPERARNDGVGVVV